MTTRLFQPRDADRDESGAAAMEFALVSLILIPLILGMVQYGLYFNDFLQVRQGVRQAARSAVVQSASVTCSPAGATDAATLACFAKSNVSPVTGNITVQVKTVTVGSNSSGWVRGNQLIVCAAVTSAAPNAGILPVPNGGVVYAKTVMSIEKDSTNGGATPTGYPGPVSTNATDPTGKNWSWCA